jgi:hypothetical protein
MYVTHARPTLTLADPSHCAHALVQDHGYNSTHVVMLVNAEPDHSWKSLVLQYSKNERAVFLYGDLRNDVDAARVCIDRAAAVFILTDRNSPDLREAEKRTFMRALSARHGNPSAPIFVQVRRAVRCMPSTVVAHNGLQFCIAVPHQYAATLQVYLSHCRLDLRFACTHTTCMPRNYHLSHCI